MSSLGRPGRWRSYPTRPAADRVVDQSEVVLTAQLATLAVTADALEVVHPMLVHHDTGEGVVLDSAAWLITARRP